MRMAGLCLLLLGCGPVLLGEEGPARDTGPARDAAAASDAGGAPEADATGNAPLLVTVSVRAVDCGKCFDLSATALGGQLPYVFEWEDGSLGPTRQVCTGDAELTPRVVARDAAGARSAEYAIRLQGLSGAGCSTAAPAPPPAPKLCLENMSFEGMPAPNVGQPNAFDAKPWSACTQQDTANNPSIVDQTIGQSFASLPMPSDGSTFLALGEETEVSQPFCDVIRDGAAFSVELDLSRVDVGTGIVPQTEQVFLEIWGGLSVDCSRRELLWASPALKVGWKRFCATLRPRGFMTQLTLRANTDKTLSSSSYLIVDNLRPVDGCR